MAKRLMLFNSTGGVSNTMSIYNLGWLMAEKYRVLLVDADPKCDLTGMMLRDRFDAHYSEERTRRHNLKDATRAAFELDTLGIREIDCPCTSEAPNLHLLPGHANLSEYDFYLMLAQDANDKRDSLQGTPGAFNRLISLCERKHDIDFTLINVATGFGGVNANLFMHSDVFVVPAVPDPFAIQALDTLKYVLARWLNWKTHSMADLASASYPLREGTPKFGGVLLHRCDNRNGRSSRHHPDLTTTIKSAISNDFVPHLAKQHMTFPRNTYPCSLQASDYCLQECWDLESLTAKSLEIGIPAFVLSDLQLQKGGEPAGDLIQQRDQVRSQVQHVADQLVSLLHHA
ncbi:ParA family protein [Pandoraea sputorum]